ncbi:CBS domain-containing protein [Aegicerativicinus sediminis]|uniref:CBS domain-containing protein n=1 Tax=Aegicerativicinus sediminis TaxID=2893202 RepID=UPI001E42E7C9|nr:CBS domain-containing protein [Aegicerativicinus sediminis]
MLLDKPITEIMTKHVITLTLKDDLETAENLFKRNRIRHIPVVSNGIIEGMLSKTDLLRISFADSINDEDKVESVVYNMFDISQVMTKNLETITTNTTIREVAEILSRREYHALPVMEYGRLVGIVTSTDLIKYMLYADKVNS